jgi:hypothetical protein
MSKPRYIQHAEAIAKTERLRVEIFRETDPAKRKKLKARLYYWENRRSQLS